MKRDPWLVEHGLLDIIDADIVVVVDKNNNCFAFKLSDPVEILFTKDLQHKFADIIKIYTTRCPLSVPDDTRHGSHWADWMRKQPNLDFRNPANDPWKTMSGLLHLGEGYMIGDLK